MNLNCYTSGNSPGGGEGAEHASHDPPITYATEGVVVGPALPPFELSGLTPHTYTAVTAGMQQPENISQKIMEFLDAALPVDFFDAVYSTLEEQPNFSEFSLENSQNSASSSTAMEDPRDKHSTCFNYVGVELEGATASTSSTSEDHVDTSNTGRSKSFYYVDPQAVGEVMNAPDRLQQPSADQLLNTSVSPSCMLQSNGGFSSAIISPEDYNYGEYVADCDSILTVSPLQDFFTSDQQLHPLPQSTDISHNAPLQNIPVKVENPYLGQQQEAPKKRKGNSKQCGQKRQSKSKERMYLRQQPYEDKVKERRRKDAIRAKNGRIRNQNTIEQLRATVSTLEKTLNFQNQYVAKVQKFLRDRKMLEHFNKINGYSVTPTFPVAGHTASE